MKQIARGYTLGYLELKELFGKTVIIKLNNFLLSVYPDDTTRQSICHPRFGHVGIVVAIVEDNLVQVKFEDGQTAVFPAEQIFYLRWKEQIWHEVISSSDLITDRHGKTYQKRLWEIYNAVKIGEYNKALTISYSSIYCYHFLTFLGCPKSFPEDIEEQVNDDKDFSEYRQFLNMRQPENNILHDFHDTLTQAAILFKKMVCMECGYTNSMYKKKMKTDRTKPSYDNITEPLSNAEWESIQKQGDIILKGITDCINSYKPKK
jgi:hypothetical protein